MKTISKFLVLNIALLVFSCSSGPEKGKENSESTESTEKKEAPAPVEITVNATGNTMAEMKYDLEEIRVKEGAEVTIILENKGTDETMLHNIVFIQAGTADAVGKDGMQYKESDYVNESHQSVIAGSKLAKPGEKVTFKFTAPEAGEYEFICTYPGHWSKMKGKFIVE